MFQPPRPSPRPRKKSFITNFLNLNRPNNVLIRFLMSSFASLKVNGRRGLSIRPEMKKREIARLWELSVLVSQLHICPWVQFSIGARTLLTRHRVFYSVRSLSHLSRIACTRSLQRDVVNLDWPIAPSYMSPNAAGEGEFRGLSQWVQLYTGAQISVGDLTP